MDMKAFSLEAWRLVNMFPRKLTAHSLTPNTTEAYKIRNLMTVMAWVCLVIGFVLSLMSITTLSDENHILMIGIGFLVASFHIYVIGLFMALMFKVPAVKDEDIELKPEEIN